MTRSKCPECREEEYNKLTVDAPFRHALKITVNKFWGSVLVFKDDKLCENHDK
ncbi:hypothetical protein KAR91_09870 [Candidatus Pacearchaeota archaeon]|nr:hypothetical protein [Candidatus Pacearchaeota archaeon]